MSLHDRLLAELQSLAEVRLVASLRDERLNFPDANDLRVFLPDIHLITEERRIRGGFLYGTNLIELLHAVVRKLKDFKRAAAPGEQVTVYQIGDLLDLWRQTDGRDPDLDVASAIQNDHEDLIAALLDSELNTQFLLGNHDYDLYRFANFAAWERYLYLSQSVLLMHGDILDWVEQLPDQLQTLFVFLFSPRVKPTGVQLGRMRAINQQMRDGHNFRAFIRDAAPAPLGVSMVPDSVPLRWNVQVEGEGPKEMLTFLDAAHRKCRQADREFSTSLRAAIIGHTHHARIVVRESADDFFALIDCGAWIENCITEDDPTPRPNAQIGVLGANEARIYQLGLH